ncbi:biotin/lipoate A/B protein ligase family protein, partial [Elusimicrobiota bacterium]
AQMALDEAVLGLAEKGACYLRFYRWPEGARVHGVTFGRSQRFEDVEVAVRRRCAGITFPVVRRCTGGGIVFHDGDLTFSFVFPWTRLSGPEFVYRRVHMSVQVGLRAHGVHVRLWKREATATASGRRVPAVRRECFSGPEPEDLVDERGEKIVGGALWRRRGMGLYQGSMRREGLGPSSERLDRVLVEGFGLQWKTVFEPGPPRAAVAAEAERLRLEKYSRDSWNKRR